jgi:hypothetical protein
MPAKPTLHNIVTDAARAGVSTNRFKISREDANRIKAAERRSPQEGLHLVLQLLFKPRES